MHLFYFATFMPSNLQALSGVLDYRYRFMYQYFDENACTCTPCNVNMSTTEHPYKRYEALCLR